MRIDLNSIVFNEVLNKDAILRYLSQEDIYTYYIGDDYLTQSVINSPLRKDNIPSFAIYHHKHYRDKLMFYDFATKDTGDCFILVSKMYNLTMKQTFLKIAYDFKLSDIKQDGTINFNHSPKLIKKDKIELGIKSRQWLNKDKWFWQQFKIKRSTLEFFKVKPVSHIFYNDYVVKADELAYAYEELKDNQISYKIYQPKSESYKWINNADYSVHQGYTQLPKTGKLLIITKSLKDVMSIYDNCSMSAVGLQSESVSIKPSVVDEYKQRFETVLFLFDNDPPGIRFSKMMSNETGLDYFLLPTIDKIKDFSDLMKYNPDIDIFYNALNTLNKNET
jgi:hypothetical protein